MVPTANPPGPLALPTPTFPITHCTKSPTVTKGSTPNPLTFSIDQFHKKLVSVNKSICHIHRQKEPLLCVLFCLVCVCVFVYFYKQILQSCPPYIILGLHWWENEGWWKPRPSFYLGLHHHPRTICWRWPDLLPHCTRCRYFLVFELATWEIIYHATFSAPTDNSEPSCLFTNLEISLFKNCFGIQILACSMNQRLREGLCLWSW